MPRASQAVPVSPALLVCACLTLACHNGGSGKPAVLPSAIGGEWELSSAPSADTCPGGTGVTLPEGGFRIDDSVPTLPLFQEGCCGDVVWGTGSLDGRVLSFAGAHDVARDTTCTLHLEEAIVGTLVDRDHITGEATISISASAGTCGSGLPCQVHGAITASRCPWQSCRPLCLNFAPCPA